MHRAVIQIPVEKEQARTLVGSLSPESRAETDMVFTASAEDDGVVMTIEAQDISDLRAAVNSYMRLALVALAVTEKGR